MSRLQSFFLLLLFILTAGCHSPIRVADGDLRLDQVLAESAKQRLAVIVRETLREPNGTLPAATDTTILQTVKQPVYVVLRTEGRRAATGWAEEGNWENNTREAIRQAILSLPGYDAVSIDSVEIGLTHSYQPFEWTGRTTLDLELTRGIEGLELRALGRQERFPPTLMLERNLSFSKAFRDFFRQLGKDSKKLGNTEFESRRFQCYQILVSRYPDAVATQMYRGSRWPDEKLTDESLKELKSGLESWVKNQVAEDGSIPGRYEPGTDHVQDERVVVREWLVTWALGKLAQSQPEYREVYDRNLRYNLTRSYRTDGQNGFIAERRLFPLGGVALAGLALLEGPAPDDTDPILTSLVQSLSSFQEEDGKLRGYTDPEAEDLNQSYYPPEALLFWTNRYRQTKDPELLKRLKLSFNYYRAKLEETPDLDSVPWQSLAAYSLWRATNEELYLDFLFSQADQVTLQFNSEPTTYLDFRGQFQRGDKPGSVNATGAQLLGLSHAYKAALKKGDKARAAAYKSALNQGFYHLTTLQYRTPVDMFCVREVDRAKGGLRHSPLNLTVQADSAAYPLLTLEFLGPEFKVP